MALGALLIANMGIWGETKGLGFIQVEGSGGQKKNMEKKIIKKPLSSPQGEKTKASSKKNTGKVLKKKLVKDSKKSVPVVKSKEEMKKKQEIGQKIVEPIEKKDEKPEEVKNLEVEEKKTIPKEKVDQESSLEAEENENTGKKDELVEELVTDIDEDSELDQQKDDKDQEGERSQESGGAQGNNSPPDVAEALSYTQLKQKEGNPIPAYPKEALEKGWTGEVLVLYYVNSYGFVEKIQLAHSSGHSILDNAALRIVSKYRYHSGQEGWVSHPFQFSIDSDKKETPLRVLDPLLEAN